MIPFLQKEPEKAITHKSFHLAPGLLALSSQKNILKTWFESEYEGGNSAPKVDRINYYQEFYSHK